VPELISPDVAVHASFLAAMEEFRAEGRGRPDDDTMVGAEMREFTGSWSTLAGFAAFVAALRAQAQGEHLPAGFVPCTTLWWTNGDTYLGRIAIRHQLTPRLRQVGGHIGYDVRPTARRQGHATAMLRAALPVARHIGLERVLITCDVTNIASRKVIESCGGKLEDQHAGKLRFWTSTSCRSGAQT
jgi:predicted acetyltransferase